MQKMEADLGGTTQDEKSTLGAQANAGIEQPVETQNAPDRREQMLNLGSPEEAAAAQEQLNMKTKEYAVPETLDKGETQNAPDRREQMLNLGSPEEAAAAQEQLNMKTKEYAVPETLDKGETQNAPDRREQMLNLGSPEEAAAAQEQLNMKTKEYVVPETLDKGETHRVSFTNAEGKEEHGHIIGDGDNKYRVIDSKGNVVNVDKSALKILSDSSVHKSSTDGFINESNKTGTPVEAEPKYKIYKTDAEAIDALRKENPNSDDATLSDLLEKNKSEGKVLVGDMRVKHSITEAVADMMKENPNMTAEEARKAVIDDINSGKLIIDHGYGYKDGTYDIAPDEVDAMPIPGIGAQITGQDVIFEDGDYKNVTDEYQWQTNRTKTLGLVEDPFAKEIRLNSKLEAEIKEQQAMKRDASFYSLAKEATADSKHIISGSIYKADFNKMSKLGYISTYAATGQHSVKDLMATVAAMESNGFKFSDETNFFYGTEWEKIYQQNKDQDYKPVVEKLIADVEQIKLEYDKAYANMQQWSGVARGETKIAIETIMGKFQVTMANIQDALKPTVESIEKFMEKLEELKTKDELLRGKNADGLAEGCLVKNAEDARKKLEEHKKNAPDAKVDQKYTEKDTDGNDVEKIPKVDNPAYISWSNQENLLVQEVKKHEEAEAALRAELIALATEVLVMYYQTQNFMQTFETFSSYFGTGRNAQRISSAGAIHDNFKLIREDFEEYSKMPVITNLTDYKLGEVLIFDDAHGISYRVTGKYDPLTGTITIAAFDKNGNKIGKDITIWDQREIAPEIRRPGVTRRPQDEDKPPITTVVPPPPTTVVPPPPPFVPPVPPTPPPFVPPPPTTVVPPPTPTDPFTPTPTDPFTPTPTDPVTPPPDPTSPGTNPLPTTPHTGLGMYGALQAGGTNLGALAGLAAGAAGLGLTGMMKDKKEDEETKEESKEEVKDKVDEEDMKTLAERDVVEKYENLLKSLSTNQKDGE